MAAENFRHDPAIDRFNTMRESAYLNFKWTRRTVTSSVLGFLVVPTIFYYITVKSNHKYDWTAKRKGESLELKQ